MPISLVRVVPAWQVFLDCARKAEDDLGADAPSGSVKPLELHGFSLPDLFIFFSFSPRKALSKHFLHPKKKTKKLNKKGQTYLPQFFPNERQLHL